ncbi:MAG: hypothetical protein WD078_13385 [Woeseia sp.]|nr:hypothetical protein [Woeseiaceae bacterium]
MNARAGTTKRGLFSLSVFALLLFAVVAAQGGYGRPDTSIAASEREPTLLVLRLATMVLGSSETGQ